MQIQIQHVNVHPLLKGYIEKIFVLETEGRVRDPGLKAIVPNGFLKLVVPICNGLVGERAGYSKVFKPNQVTFVGVSDTPFKVNAEMDAPSSIVTIEFSPLGAYHLFSIRHSELKTEIIGPGWHHGRKARDLEELLININEIDPKIECLRK